MAGFLPWLEDAAPAIGGVGKLMGSGAAAGYIGGSAPPIKHMDPKSVRDFVYHYANATKAAKGAVTGAVQGVLDKFRFTTAPKRGREDDYIPPPPPQYPAVDDPSHPYNFPLPPDDYRYSSYLCDSYLDELGIPCV